MSSTIEASLRKQAGPDPSADSGVRSSPRLQGCCRPSGMLAGGLHVTASYILRRMLKARRNGDVQSDSQSPSWLVGRRLLWGRPDQRFPVSRGMGDLRFSFLYFLRLAFPSDQDPACVFSKQVRSRQTTLFHLQHDDQEFFRWGAFEVAGEFLGSGTNL